MKIEKHPFGKYGDITIHQFILENKNGMVVKIMDFGATITSITVPGKDGKPVSIVCGFDKFEDYFSEEYKANAPYFGCTVGRYCSQIKDAKFILDGKNFQLKANCGSNNLHGGVVGFDKKIWDAQSIPSEDGVAVQFNLFSKDMEEGFPGNVEASVIMKLTNNNEIIFDYSASTDKATPFSMTNHSYFNLSGFKETVEDYWVKVNTNKLLELDETGAVTGIVTDVSETINDLQGGRIVNSVHQEINDGFEHFYVFDNEKEELMPVAEVQDKNSGRKLEVFSNEPCMLFYTGKYTSDKLQRNENERYGQYRGFACETHRWPNGPNIGNSPGSILKPNEKFKSQTIFKITN